MITSISVHWRNVRLKCIKVTSHSELLYEQGFIGKILIPTYSVIYSNKIKPRSNNVTSNFGISTFSQDGNNLQKILFKLLSSFSPTTLIGYLQDQGHCRMTEITPKTNPTLTVLPAHSPYIFFCIIKVKQSLKKEIKQALMLPKKVFIFMQSDS